jgi:hypothetical protein
MRERREIWLGFGGALFGLGVTCFVVVIMAANSQLSGPLFAVVVATFSLVAFGGFYIVAAVFGGWPLPPI